MTATGAPSSPAAPVGLRFLMSRAVIWWALLGAAFVILQLYVYAAWLLRGDPAPVGTGADPVPGGVRVWAWLFQVLVPCAFALCLAQVVRDCRARRRLSFDALLLGGWFLVYWQDHMPVLWRADFSYSSYLVNLSSWAPQVPGWVSRGDDRTPAPLLLTSALFPLLGVCTAVVICAVLCRCARLPGLRSRPALIAVAVATGMVLDLVCESALLLTGLISYPGTVGALTLWPGRPYQFPLYEAVLLGCVWGVAGALRYFRNTEGRSAIERDATGLPPRVATTVRILAVAGVLNSLFLSYALLFNTISLHGDPVDQDRPSHLLNAGCPPPGRPPCAPATEGTDW
ncbi:MULTISPECIES: spirocyclase AveC family protein [unclassified Streptomyces]|uniref:spirocyclase AveC family protein n=1 Tax=unclassified Streptomyces TaxID=2593676 RepID=UPI0033ED45DB